LSGPCVYPFSGSLKGWPSRTAVPTVVLIRGCLWRRFFGVSSACGHYSSSSPFPSKSHGWDLSAPPAHCSLLGPKHDITAPTPNRFPPPPLLCHLVFPPSLLARLGSFYRSSSCGYLRPDQKKNFPPTPSANPSIKESFFALPAGGLQSLSRFITRRPDCPFPLRGPPLRTLFDPGLVQRGLPGAFVNAPFGECFDFCSLPKTSSPGSSPLPIGFSPREECKSFWPSLTPPLPPPVRCRCVK